MKSTRSKQRFKPFRNHLVLGGAETLHRQAISFVLALWGGRPAPWRVAAAAVAPGSPTGKETACQPNKRGIQNGQALLGGLARRKTSNAMQRKAFGKKTAVESMLVQFAMLEHLEEYASPWKPARRLPGLDTTICGFCL
jgi:hypothetical protein